MKAWHFLEEGNRLGRHGGHHGRRRIIKPGMDLRVDGELVMCERGLHASKRLIDALGYAPGPIVCRVEVSGKIIHDGDKLVAARRKVLWMFDASTLLHTFACDEAERALIREREAGREPDPRSWAAIEAKRRWLRGEITDNELTAAAAVTVAAAAAAEAAAAETAAEAVFTVAAWGAAWAAANRRLTARVMAEHRRRSS